MTDDLTARLAGIQRAMAAPLPTSAELAAWQAEDKAMAERIHRARPGVPVHLAYAVLDTLRTIRHLDAAREKPAPSCRWPACLSAAEQQQLADDVGKELLGEPTEPGPDPRPGCGCVDRGIGDDGVAEPAAVEAAALPTRATGGEQCGYVKERWDGPYRLRDRCIGQPGHTREHGPWEMLP